MRFNFSKPLLSVKILNDAAMQALGSYKAAACCFWDLGRAWGQRYCE